MGISSVLGNRRKDQVCGKTVHFGIFENLHKTPTFAVERSGEFCNSLTRYMLELIHFISYDWKNLDLAELLLPPLRKT